MKKTISLLGLSLLTIALFVSVYSLKNYVYDLRSKASEFINPRPLVFVQISTDWNAPWGQHRDVQKPYDQWGSWYNWVFRPEEVYTSSSWRRKIASLIYPAPITGNFTSDLVTIDPKNIKYAGSYPYIGPYDSSTEEIIRWQIHLAKNAGVDAFAVSVADVDTDGRTNDGKAICPNALVPYQNSGLDRFKEFLSIARQENFKIFAEMWVPFYVNDPNAVNNPNICGSRPSWVNAVSKVIRQIGADPTYLQINNKPVVSIGSFGDNQTLSNDLKQVVAGSGKNIYWLVRLDSTNSQLQNNPLIDALGVGSVLKPQTYIKNPDYQDQYNEIIRAKTAGKKVAARIYPGFDDAFRRLILIKDYKPMGMARIDGSGKNVFATQIANALRAGVDYLWIESWNDYTEQSTIEPARVVAGENRQDFYRDLRTLANSLGKNFVEPLPPSLDKQGFDPLIYSLLFPPVISNAGVTTSYNPWAVWVQGKNLSPDLKAQLYDGSTQWGGDLSVTLSTDGSWLSFQLPGNTPPSKCNERISCNIYIALKDPVGGLISNRFTLVLPAFVSPVPPMVTNAGVNTSYQPWAVWVIGKNLNQNIKIQLYDGSNRWGGNIPIILSADKTWLSFSLPSSSPPSKCNVGRQCQISVKLVDLSNNLSSNEFSLLLPATQ